MKVLRYIWSAAEVILFNTLIRHHQRNYGEFTYLERIEGVRWPPNGDLISPSDYRSDTQNFITNAG